MRCERCKFENIPGQKTCIKCGSALEIKSIALNVYPPRVPRWRKPFRKAFRCIRRFGIVPQQRVKSHVPGWLKDLFSDSVLGLFLSIIPGLAHLIQNRFREIRWYFLAWLVLVVSGLFIYGSTSGYICLGLAIGVHAAIAVQYGIIRDLTNVIEKAIIVIFVLIGLALIYRYIPRLLLPNLFGGYSGLTIAYHKVEAGDYLLAWGDLDPKELLSRGSLVLIHPVTLTNYGRNRATRSGDLMVGQIVGLAGEQVDIADGAFVVDGQQLDTGKYPIPQWLRRTKLSVRIPGDEYFVSVPYTVRAHGVRLSSSYIGQVCVLQAGDIEAKAFMLWWPLSRRGFLR